MEPEVYENIQKYIPGQLMASGELLDGYVTGVTPVEGRVHTATVNTADGTLEIPVNEGKLDLIFYHRMQRGQLHHHRDRHPGGAGGEDPHRQD